MLDFSDCTRTGISKLISRCAAPIQDIDTTYGLHRRRLLAKREEILQYDKKDREIKREKVKHFTEETELGFWNN